MQEGNVVCYESCKIKEHEKNYATHDLELAAIVHALKMWRQYLLGRKFELKTNHMSLKYLFEQWNLNAKPTRWMDFVCEFDFEIKHMKGKENKVVDEVENSMSQLSVFEKWILGQRFLTHCPATSFVDVCSFMETFL